MTCPKPRRRKAIQLALDTAQAYANRGVAYGSLGRFQRAIQDYDKAAQLDHNFARAYGVRGVAYSVLGQDAKADADKAKACSLATQYESKAWKC